MHRRNRAISGESELNRFASKTLQQKYNDEVPVILIDGRKAFKYRIDPQQFLRTLAGRARS
jgi:hypothetical protein